MQDAQRPADLRASVVVNYVSRPAAAEGVVAAIRQRDGQAIAAKADVSEPAEAEALVAEAVRAFVRLHVLANNAGITRDRLILRMTEEESPRCSRVMAR